MRASYIENILEEAVGERAGGRKVVIVIEGARGELLGKERG